ncbi:MAG: hypothetical protein OMM_07368 [Candidatus Magnetoglobus multicellularis str. Araruama]|uniref:Uncharacterized protein n=1 Tax=Candidatus Magnetoglobus multicellularis str. Araruama TaxID=890399 RepID=A0A1V1PD27_9BACT|nr:MAG: hypothetical protein OMM_07368 [Candidatus Magnetoglobus multicellularis str. Araruama]
MIQKNDIISTLNDWNYWNRNFSNTQKRQFYEDYSGQTEYLTSELAYLLDYEFEDINIPFFHSKDGYFGQWARPDMNQFRYYMRYIYENQDEARQKGLNASKKVHEQWTWEHAAKIAVKEIEHLIKREGLPK